MKHSSKPSTLIYEVYVESFCDSRGGEEGDLRGIISKLPYLSSLGVDNLWLTPIGTAGGKDGHYDPLDQTAIDRVFGTIQDFDELVSEAAQKNIGIIVDVIPGHVSTQHPWFQEACRGLYDPKRDYFVWLDPKDLPSRELPNWLSMFGRDKPVPAWTLHEPTGQYYLHHFFSHQPTLNLRHPAVRDGIKNIIRFYKEHKVAGFRIDAVDALFHDTNFHDNPLRNLPPGDKSSPFNQQVHMHDILQMSPTISFLAELRKEAGDAAFMIAELSSQTMPYTVAHRIAGYTQKAGFDAAYSLKVAREKDLTPRHFYDMHTSLAEEGCERQMCWATQCHDEERREHTAAEAELKFYLSLLMPGHKCIYYGEECLQANDRSKEGLDPYNRAVARGMKDWGLGLIEQERDPQSCLNRYKRAIGFWQENREFFDNGSFEFKDHGNSVHLAYHDRERSMQFVVNPTNAPLFLDKSKLHYFYPDDVETLMGLDVMNVSDADYLVIPAQGILKLEGPPFFDFESHPRAHRQRVAEVAQAAL